MRTVRHGAANEAMLKWLRAPALPRPFVLELLDFVLGHSAALFREIPAFEHALLVRVCMLLTTQLQNLLDPACDPTLQARIGCTGYSKNAEFQASLAFQARRADTACTWMQLGHLHVWAPLNVQLPVLLDLT